MAGMRSVPVVAQSPLVRKLQYLACWGKTAFKHRRAVQERWLRWMALNGSLKFRCFENQLPLVGKRRAHRPH